MIAQLLTLVRADLRTQLRSPMVLMFAIVVPAALIIVLHLVFTGGQSDSDTEPARVAIAETGPADADARAIAAVTDALGGVDSLAVQPTADPRAEVDAGRADLAVLLDGSSAELVRGDASRVTTQVVAAVTREVLEGIRAAGVAGAAADDLGLDPTGTGGVATAAFDLRPGQAADAQLDVGGSLVAGQAGLFLLFTVGFAVLTLNTEREQGTLQRLYAAPMPRRLVITAKAVTAAVLGCLSTGVLLITGSLLFDLDFGSIPLISALVVAVVVAATSVAFIVARVARTAEQASMAQTVVALVLGIAGGAFFPLAATGVAATILDANPISAFTRGLGITSAGGGWSDIAGPLATMGVFAICCLLIARLVPDRGRAR